MLDRCPGRRSGWPRCRAAARGRASCSSGSARAASAAPTCTSSTASSPTRSCRWSPGTRSSARPRTAAGSACPGSAGPAATCRYCTSGRENLCDRARFTGYDLDGGYAEWAVADERFCFPIPEGYGDLEAAPLLCAGLIGYRALRLAGDARAARPLRLRRRRAHRRPGRALGGPPRLRVHARGRRARAGVRALARRRVGRRRAARPRSSTPRSSSRRPASSSPPRSRAVAQGRHGRLRRHPHVRHPSFPYDILWGERMLRSVANLTRRDGEELLALAPRVPVRTRSRRSRSRRRTRRSRSCAPATSRARSVIVP